MTEEVEYRDSLINNLNELDDLINTVCYDSELAQKLRIEEDRIWREKYEYYFGNRKHKNAL